MTSGLVVARAIHDNLTVAEVNAWHYWWLVERSDTEPGRGGLIGEDVVTRRAYVVGQYSRFVRPGSTRVRLSSSNPQRGVFASAFVGGTGDELALVVINENATPVTQAFDFTGAESSELAQPSRTTRSPSKRRVPFRAAAFVTLELSPRSVTTFTGLASGRRATPTENPACSHVAPRVLPPEESDATGCSCRQAGRSPASGAAARARRATRRDGSVPASTRGRARQGIVPIVMIASVGGEQRVLLALAAHLVRALIGDLDDDLERDARRLRRAKAHVDPRETGDRTRDPILNQRVVLANDSAYRRRGSRTWGARSRPPRASLLRDTPSADSR